MSWVIDTCIVIDVLENDPSFGLRSATLLEEKLGEGLSICPVTFVELAPAFEGNWEQQERFLGQAGIGFRDGWTTTDTRTAHHEWHLHITARRSGMLAKRPIADVLIGAYAMNRLGLITRNPADFRKNFPNLKILEP
jgi:predicted nucleic acid-binding protein